MQPFCHLTKQLCVDTLNSSDFETSESLPWSLIFVFFKHAQDNHNGLGKTSTDKVLAHPVPHTDTIGYTVPLVFLIICYSQTLTPTLIAALE